VGRKWFEFELDCPKKYNLVFSKTVIIYYLVSFIYFQINPKENERLEKS